MAKTFFNGWELWQKMTFVLAVAIALVVAVAYGKLLWTNRLIRKQEIIDEEKRVRVQELRNSGQLKESPPKPEIPFGIRAIQSGIQIDGIWISNTNTPVPSELRFGNSRSLDSKSRSSSNVTNAGTDTPPTFVKPIALDRATSVVSQHTKGRLSSFLENADDSSSSFNRSIYQARHSSYLRNPNYGDFDELTLSKLEGGIRTSRSDAHRPWGYGDEATQLFTGHKTRTSSDSGNTTESKEKAGPSSKPTKTKTKSDYFAVPTENPPNDISDPFATPAQNSLMSPASSIRPARRNSWEEDSKDVAHSQARPSSSFIPGELHANKVVRRVNSGFEVLPAGTFGTAAIDRKGKGIDRSDRMSEDSTEKRISRRLQKKRKDSAFGT